MADSLDPVSRSSSAIVDGRAERGNPSVVLLYNLGGSTCTGAIIAPRVVLTAKHCIQGRGAGAAPASQFRIYVGSSQYAVTSEYRVEEIRPAPGCWDANCGDASDIAVLLLSSAAGEPPLEVSFDSPHPLTGQMITAVGYGQTPAGASGTKYRTEKRVTGVDSGFIAVEPTVCPGDSGSPLIGPDGRVYGVASFIVSPDGRTRPTCGTAPGVYNTIHQWRDLIEGAIEDSGACFPDGDEVCDGDDDDCDGEVDEGCIPIGGACSSSDECVGNLCEETPVGRVCTQPCDPLRPEVGCGPGLYCARTSGCDGLCAPLSEAMANLGNGADCDTDDQCGSRFCTDPGDGHRRCLSPCRGDSGMCLSGEVCAAVPEACGGCVRAGLVAAPRGIGEPCDVDDQCRSSSCFDDAGVLYCSRDCDGDMACGDGFHCRAGMCARGNRGDVGAGCVTNEDCASGALCAARGDVRWCTVQCHSAGCPLGFECVDAGEAKICAPEASLLGESCDIGEDCVSELCVDGGAGAVCSQFCGPEAHCAAGFECIRTADGLSSVCMAPASSVTGSGGGCSAAGHDARSHVPLSLSMLLVGAVILRRRRRR